MSIASSYNDAHLGDIVIGERYQKGSTRSIGISFILCASDRSRPHIIAVWVLARYFAIDAIALLCILDRKAQNQRATRPYTHVPFAWTKSLPPISLHSRTRCTFTWLPNCLQKWEQWNCKRTRDVFTNPVINVYLSKFYPYAAENAPSCHCSRQTSSHHPHGKDQTPC